MIFSYVPRLLCLCFASFFLVYAVSTMLACRVSGRAVRLAQKMSPRPAAWFLFALRVVPFALSCAVVLGLCVPSYLWLEPQATGERIGFACVVFAVFGVALWCTSLFKVFRAFSASYQHRGLYQDSGYETRLPGESLPVVIVEDESPLLALVGVFRSRLLVSRSVLRKLSSEQLDAALRHENAHLKSRDNLKRLVLLLATDIVPFSSRFAVLEQHWAKFSEWAADDQAATGDPVRALSLASALVSIARMGAAPRLPFLHAPLVAGDHDLSARVERLLHAHPYPLTAGAKLREPHSFLRSASFLAATSISVLLLWPPVLFSAHRLLELFLR
jgi:Zn-dependent protease with chaperone function